MIELNLLPDIKQEFVRARRQKRLVIATMTLVTIVAVAIVALLGFYAYAGQTIRQKLADDAIVAKDKELKTKKDLVRDLTIQNQLSAVTQLHETKGVYERLFGYMKTLNPEAPNNVSISKITVDTATGTLLVEASAKDYQAVTVFKDTLQNAQLKYVDTVTKDKVTSPLFTAVEISDTGIGKDSSGNQVASFKANLTYDTAAFAWTIKSPSIKVPNKKTNQSAGNVSVFADTPVKKEGQP